LLNALLGHDGRSSLPSPARRATSSKHARAERRPGAFADTAGIDVAARATSEAEGIREATARWRKAICSSSSSTGVRRRRAVLAETASRARVLDSSREE